jgi:AraC family transcriptional regulator
MHDMSIPETTSLGSKTELCPSGLFGQHIKGLGIELTRCNLSPEDIEFPALQSHLLTLNLGKAGDLSRVQSLHTQKVWMIHGGMTLTPAGQSRHWYWNHSTNVLVLQLPPSLISNTAIAAELDISQIELVDRFGFYDPQLEFIGKSLLAEMQSDGLAGELYTESLINLLVIHLLRQHSAFGHFPVEGRRTPFTAPNQFSPSRLKQVLDYIHDNLGQSLSLAELAGIANLSSSRFTRVFRQEMGVSPHQYILQARIERAKHLLQSKRNLSIGNIAYQVGFADQSHFTRHFKRIVGVTPKVVMQNSRNVLNHSPNIQAEDF